ncbi:MAG: response regulator transcription factor [Oscillospiraceae bacterium]|nr:response regulator transcription factor [Oscillospiraceae bacterium]
MIRVALVEDSDADAAVVCDYFSRYEKEKGISVNVKRFNNAVIFLDPYLPEYDLVIMDIQMPYMNGMDAAHKLRELDNSVLLVFMTSLKQYALQGYEVQAANYFVKPISYFDFSLKLEKTLLKTAAISSRGIIIRSDIGSVRLSPETILYVEAEGHHVIFHTLSGDYTQYGSISEAAKKLGSFNFAFCNRCYLVNLRFVQSIKGYDAVLDGCVLRISQPKKRSFLAAFEAYASSL